MSKIANWQYCKPINNTIFYLSPSIRSHLTFAMHSWRGRNTETRRSKKKHSRNKSRKQNFALSKANFSLSFVAVVTVVVVVDSCFLLGLCFSGSDETRQQQQIALNASKVAPGTSRFSRKLARASSSSSSSSYSSLVRFIGNLLFTSYNVSQNSPRKVTKFNSINKFLNLIRPKLPAPEYIGYAQHKTRFGTAKFVNYSILKVKTILSSWQLHSPNNPPCYSPNQSTHLTFLFGNQV